MALHGLLLLLPAAADALRQSGERLSRRAGWTLSSPATHGHSAVAVKDADVPSDVHDVLESAGLLPNLYQGLNSQMAAAWVPNRTWVYSTTFSLPDRAVHARPSASDGQSLDWSTLLRFEGCDYNCTVWVNGVEVGSNVGAFQSFELNVSVAPLTADYNTLSVVLHPPPAALLGRLYAGPDAELLYGVDQCLWNTLLPMWKSRLTFWDFATKLWSVGLWRDVYVRFVPSRAAFFALNPAVTSSVDPAKSSAVMQLRAPLCCADCSEQGCVSAQQRLAVNVTVQCSTHLDDAPAASTLLLLKPADFSPALSTSGRAACGKARLREISVSIPLERIRLWSPNGYGEQALYNVTAALLLLDGPTGREPFLLDRVEVSTGFRNLQLVSNPIAHRPGGESNEYGWLYNQYGQGGTPTPWVLNSSISYPDGIGLPSKYNWTFAVNGEPVFARGANWVPLDQMYGRAVRQRDRMEATLRMAAEMGVTFLRVWGGGLREDDFFYRMCDELGILVQQDLPLAGCPLTPPWNGTLGELYRMQTRTLLHELSPHPSVARYTFANEFYLNSSSCPYQAAFQRDVAQVDGTRVGEQADPTCVAQRHGPYQFSFLGSKVTYDAYGKGCSSVNAHLVPGGCRFHDPDAGPPDPFEWSEFGISAMPDASSLARFLSKASLRAPPGSTDEWRWHKSDLWLANASYSALFLDTRRSPGAAPAAFADLEQEVRASQFVQAEAYRYSFQAASRRFPHRSLMAIWTLNEPWPNAAQGCVLAHDGSTKQAYYWIKDSLKATDVAIEYYDVFVNSGRSMDLILWIFSHVGWRQPVSVQARVLSLNGTVLYDWSTRVLASIGRARSISTVDFVPPAEMIGQVLLVCVSVSSDEVVLTQHTYSFGVVAPVQNSTSVVAPLAALLSAPRVTLRLGEVVMGADARGRERVSAQVSLHSGGLALFVKMTLCSTSGRDGDYGSPSSEACDDSQAYVAFDVSYFTLSDPFVPMAIVGHAYGAAAKMRLRSGSALLCAKAWNSPQVCCPVVEVAAQGSFGRSGRRSDQLLSVI